MPEPEGEAKLVLVADDEGDIVELVAIVLRRAGYDVITAPDGATALAHAREHAPDLCVLDGMMPRLPGFKVLEQLRADPATEAIPVLILTATVDEQREIRQHGLEPDGFFRKPFDADTLLSEVARLVA